MTIYSWLRFIDYDKNINIFIEAIHQLILSCLLPKKEFNAMNINLFKYRSF